MGHDVKIWLGYSVLFACPSKQTHLMRYLTGLISEVTRKKPKCNLVCVIAGSSVHSIVSHIARNLKIAIDCSWKLHWFDYGLLFFASLFRVNCQKTRWIRLSPSKISQATKLNLHGGVGPAPPGKQRSANRTSNIKYTNVSSRNHKWRSPELKDSRTNVNTFRLKQLTIFPHGTLIRSPVTSIWQRIAVGQWNVLWPFRKVCPNTNTQ